jgi:hypothetical protein
LWRSMPTYFMGLLLLWKPAAVETTTRLPRFQGQSQRGSTSPFIVSNGWCRPDGVCGAARGQPFADKPVVFQLTYAGAKRPQIVVSSLERDDGLTAGPMLAIFGDFGG